MRKYFYTNRVNNFGPFTLEELSEKNIQRDTLVWYEGLTEWKKAGSLPELSSLFRQVPPPAPAPSPSVGNTVNNSRTYERMPKTWLVESILATILCCLPFGIVGIVCASRVESRYYAGDTDGAFRASEEARKWTTVALITGIISYILAIIITVSFADSSVL